MHLHIDQGHAASTRGLVAEGMDSLGHGASNISLPPRDSRKDVRSLTLATASSPPEAGVPYERGLKLPIQGRKRSYYTGTIFFFLSSSPFGATLRDWSKTFFVSFVVLTIPSRVVTLDWTDWTRCGLLLIRFKTGYRS